MKIDSDSAKVGFPPPLIYMGMLFLGLAAEQVLPLHLQLTAIGRYLSGGLLILSGLGFIAAAIGLFRRAGTQPEPWKTTSSIVTDGVYSRTRNPMYLGMALVYAGIGVIVSSLAVLALLPVVIALVQTQVIAREEVYLRAKFGSVYNDYMGRVRRWI